MFSVPPSYSTFHVVPLLRSRVPVHVCSWLPLDSDQTTSISSPFFPVDSEFRIAFGSSGSGSFGANGVAWGDSVDLASESVLTPSVSGLAAEVSGGGLSSFVIDSARVSGRGGWVCR